MMPAKQQNNLTLVSHILCPYVQRSVIALEEQGLDYERIDIDLDNPPDWFKQVSPLGKVPLLIVDEDIVLFESAVIAEFINESSEGGLLSDRPVDKARQRAWIEFASALLDNIGAFYSAADEDKFNHAKKQLEDKYRRLENNIGKSEYFGDQGFSLVDAAFAPAFRYLDLFEQLVDLQLLQKYTKVAGWRLALRQRESVGKAVSVDYPNLLAEFVAERQSYLGEQARIFLNHQIAVKVPS